MKAFLLTILIAMNIVAITSSNAFARAASRGNSSGGGGDASEVRVDEIRADILKWIHNGGAKKLEFPSDLTYDGYVENMRAILQPQKVIIEFTDEKILVKNVEKTCQGFLGFREEPHISCNISRFKGTKDADQYALIHHEYAGLGGVEANIGAASDYIISSQLTGFLEEQVVLKLAVKNADPSALDVRKVKEGVMFELNNQEHRFMCLPGREFKKYFSTHLWEYNKTLELMTSVKQVRFPGAFKDYIFSYTDEQNNIKYEQTIHYDIQYNANSFTYSPLLTQISLKIFTKKEVNTGTVENPVTVMDYVVEFETSCDVNYK